MSDLDLDAIEERHADGYGLPRFVSFALIDEVRQLRERVATLEGGIREHRGTALGVELFWSHDEHLWSLLDPEDTR